MPTNITTMPALKSTVDTESVWSYSPQGRLQARHARFAQSRWTTACLHASRGHNSVNYCTLSIMSDTGGPGTPPSATSADDAASTTPPLWSTITTCICFHSQVRDEYQGTERRRPEQQPEDVDGRYLLILIVGEYFINLRVTKALCGSAQW